MYTKLMAVSVDSRAIVLLCTAETGNDRVISNDLLPYLRSLSKVLDEER
jgi:hypothetical protein